MNFFSHGFRFLDHPYLLAGTAVPDWLSYIDRKIRARRRFAEPFTSDVDPATAAIAQGIVQHHVDDDSFHRSRPFVEISMNCAVAIRDRLPADDGLRPSFLGHILVEMLLDAHLHETLPGGLDRYYQALQSVNPGVVAAAVNRITGKPTDRIAGLIPKFLEERFLYDYVDDRKLLRRLNQVMKRVGLDPLPVLLMDYFSEVRAEVHRLAPQLLSISVRPV